MEVSPPLGEDLGVLGADSHYGLTECLENGQKRDVEIFAPVQTSPGKLQGKFTLEDFELADDGRIAHCLAGHRYQVV